MPKVQKFMGVQQVLLSPDHEMKAILEYLCQQSGKSITVVFILLDKHFLKLENF